MEGWQLFFEHCKNVIVCFFCHVKSLPGWLLYSFSSWLVCNKVYKIQCHIFSTLFNIWLWTINLSITLSMRYCMATLFKIFPASWGYVITSAGYVHTYHAVGYQNSFLFPAALNCWWAFSLSLFPKPLYLWKSLSFLFCNALLFICIPNCK